MQATRGEQAAISIHSTSQRANPSPFGTLLRNPTVGGGNESYLRCDLYVGHAPGLGRRRVGDVLHPGLEHGRATAADPKPKAVTMNSVDAKKNVTVDKTVVRVNENGAFFFI